MPEIEKFLDSRPDGACRNSSLNLIGVYLDRYLAPYIRPLGATLGWLVPHRLFYYGLWGLLAWNRKQEDWREGENRKIIQVTKRWVRRKVREASNRPIQPQRNCTETTYRSAHRQKNRKNVAANRRMRLILC